MSPTRIAVYVIATLVAVFGVVFAADALVESDEERLDDLAASIESARSGTRSERVAALAGDEPVAVVADRHRVWIDADEPESTLRAAIDDALPELTNGATIVASESALTGQRGRITMRLREGRETPVDLVVELALADHQFSLIEVRRMR